MLNTELPSTTHEALDLYDTPELVLALVDDQALAAAAVRAAAPQLSLAVDAAVPRIRAGGRLIYCGAGTSGRLGVLDSVELYPTFSWPRERAVALLAGGSAAIWKAAEGAEDDFAQGAADMTALKPNAHDVALLLAASGGTPYVLGAMAAARAAGALSIGFANNPGAPVTAQAEIGITLDTGPELISGSTRLKAGTAQKIALNTFTSALMVKLHKVYGNLMVDLKPLTVRASGATDADASTVPAQCDHHAKTAIVALRKGITVAEAQAALDAADGSIRVALQ